MTIDETMAVDLNAEPTNILTGRVVQKATHYELVTRTASFDVNNKMVGGIAVTSRYPVLPEYADVKVNQALEITSAGTKPQEVMDLFSSVEGVTKVELIMNSGDSIIGYFNGGDN